MSLISKLFRKTAPEEPGETAVEPGEQAAEAAFQSGTQAEAASAPDDVAEPPAPTAEGAPESAAEQPVATSEAVDAGTPWWDESAAPADVIEPVMAPAATAPETGGGTQPLAEQATPAEEEMSSGETDDETGGTRPLTAADVPALAALRSGRGLAVAAMRDIGRVRQINQDSLYALLTTLPRESGDISLGLFVVADGMGGHHGGEVASRLAIGTVARHVLAELVVPALSDGATEALQPLIVAAVQEANRTIWEQAQLVGSDMGTTCTVALLLGRALYVGHVGDSRAYLATPGGLRQITDDHSTVGRLIKLGQLDPAEAREHPLRSQLFRTIGQQPDVLVDFIYQQVGDATHLLMCSDGLWSMLDDEVMLNVLEHSLWPQDACRELIARANLAGGEDNITAIVVSLPASNQ